MSRRRRHPRDWSPPQPSDPQPARSHTTTSVGEASVTTVTIGTPASSGQPTDLNSGQPLGLVVLVCQHHPDRPLLQYAAAPADGGGYAGQVTVRREHLRFFGGTIPYNAERDASSGQVRWRLACTSCRARPVVRESTLLRWAAATYERNLGSDTPTVPRLPV